MALYAFDGTWNDSTAPDTERDTSKDTNVHRFRVLYDGEVLRADHAFLGALDWLGELNSDPTVPRRLAPRAWHHLNTQTPAHLDLAAALMTPRTWSARDEAARRRS